MLYVHVSRTEDSYEVSPYFQAGFGLMVRSLHGRMPHEQYTKSLSRYLGRWCRFDRSPTRSRAILGGATSTNAGFT